VTVVRVTTVRRVLTATFSTTVTVRPNSLDMHVTGVSFLVSNSASLVLLGDLLVEHGRIRLQNVPFAPCLEIEFRTVAYKCDK